MEMILIRELMKEMEFLINILNLNLIKESNQMEILSSLLRFGQTLFRHLLLRLIRRLHICRKDLLHLSRSLNMMQIKIILLYQLQIFHQLNKTMLAIKETKEKPSNLLDLIVNLLVLSSKKRERNLLAIHVKL